jgi:NAD(P)-dependent dehydrogenase (short-subunit alcohol dehydrogenase family)
MSVRLKPVEQQVIVLTGATSGIGLATAHALADRGARLVLVARNDEALVKVAEECGERGGEAVTVAADVGNHDDLDHVAEIALDTFGGFDTWINNAGVAIYGTCEEVPLADHRRLFETNYWGVVHGSLIAARHLRGKGGKIINTGSVLGDRAMILQGPYSASKHAVNGFTDALRMDLETGDTPISVTQIKPSAIDTPYMEHARSYLGSAGTRNPPPSYAPELVAKAIVFACENDRRDLVVGFGGWAVAAMGAVAPRATDYLMEATGYALQESRHPGQPERRDNLYAPRRDGATRSSLPGNARRSSMFLKAQMHPALAMLTLAGLAVGIAAVRSLSPASDDGRRSRMQ